MLIEKDLPNAEALLRRDPCAHNGIDNRSRCGVADSTARYTQKTEQAASRNKDERTKTIGIVRISTTSNIIRIPIENVGDSNDVRCQGRYDIEHTVFDVGVIRGRGGHFEFTISVAFN